jgi:hypothetical protein
MLQKNHANDSMLFKKIGDVIVKTVLACEPAMFTAFTCTVPHRNNCFQLFGFDIMIDRDLNPWLLEVNLNPSLSCDSPLDTRIKSTMLSDLFNIANLPNPKTPNTL